MVSVSPIPGTPRSQIGFVSAGFVRYIQFDRTDLVYTN